MALEEMEMYGAPWNASAFAYDENGTYNGTFENCPNVNLPVVYVVTQVLYALVCVVGLLGNTLVIYVVLRYSKMQTVTNMYIVNLAIADECFLIGIPFLIVTMSLRSWPFGSFMCKAYMISTGINQFTSSIFLCIMSADRYIAVCHPIAAPRLRTPVVSRVVSAAAWTASALVMTPIFMYTTLIPTENGLSCNIVWPEREFNKGQTSFTLYSFALGFAAPLTLIFVFYCLVIRKLKTVGPKNKSKEKKRSHRKVTKLVLTVIAVYVLCWLPYWAFQVALIYSPPTECASRITVTVFLVAACFSYSNSAMNPILYAFLSDNFKKSFLKACTCAAGKDVNAALHVENSVIPRKKGGGAARAALRAGSEARAPAAPRGSRSDASTALTSRSAAASEALPLEARPAALAPLIAPNGVSHSRL
ncbi:somatostatin receptor type 2-like [Pectinophora gossypiella]|nr:somatostatin receptor type 2-like [Pectinophora gossypiella]XP_049867514.1 somatostatin receptor type 2-like [Pectinophora gossypiella]XP_049867515.1 somatostatin receptor type 2-like [Pectinophora gossypiella]XP_049867516.1 somatostatin receptor type 2-like [Pectinophora gossypiella]